MRSNFHRFRALQSQTRLPAATVIGVGLMAALALPAPGLAQSAHSRRAEVVQQLGAQFDETQSAVGVTSGGQVIEVFTTSDGSTWTMVLTRPDGTSSVIAAGDTWIRR